MEFRVLGPLEVHRDGEPVPIGSGRLRTLLAALLVAGGRTVSVDALGDALWGEDPPSDPRNALQTHVARLRARLGTGAPLVTRPPGYALEVGPDQVDARRFERLLERTRGRHEGPAVTRELLDEALALWRGPAYDEFADGVAHTEALRLAELRLVAVEERAAAGLELGEAAGLVAELEARLAEHPLRERLVELLMRALAVVDRPADAVAVLRRYRARLAEETGLEPSAALADLERRILRGEAPAPARAPTSGAPVAPTPLVGRQRETAGIVDALAAHRVVTLTGPGGVGKTRLAAEAARAVRREGGPELVWVELAAVADPTALDHVVATAAGVDPAGGTPTRGALLDALSARTLLLVLDNCEHLLEAVAALVDEARRHGPRLRVLATSRERLAVDGEQVVAVPPLPVPPSVRAGPPAADDAGEGDATRLFLDRAAAAGATGLEDHLPTVAEICRQLDGLPLAIELAAARTGALGLDDLLTALRDDAPAAVGRRRSRPPRHSDLWAVTDWSYRLLDPEEQCLFDRLSVFAGTFGSREAHAVCAPEGRPRAATIDRLAVLAERSLLARPPGASDRYRLLRPLRAFARQRLADRGEAAAVADRHAAVLTGLAEEAAGPPSTGAGRRWLEASLDDLREAHRRARRTGDVALAARLTTALYWFDYWRLGSGLFAWADDVLAMDGIEGQPTAPQVHAAAAAAAWMRGDIERSRALAERGTELGEGPDDPARMLAFAALGDVTFFEGRLERAAAAFEEVTRLARRVGDLDGEITGVTGLALHLAYTGHGAAAIERADAAARLARDADAPALAFARYTQGECRTASEPEAALRLVEEATALARSCGALFVEGVARLTATTLRGRHGDPADAVPAFTELVRHWRRSGNWTQQWTTLRNAVELLVRLGADDPAVVIATAAEADTSAAPTFGAEAARLDAALTTARARLGPAGFDAARRRGHATAAGDVVDLALQALGAESRS